MECECIIIYCAKPLNQVAYSLPSANQITQTLASEMGILTQQLSRDLGVENKGMLVISSSIVNIPTGLRPPESRNCFT